MKIFRYISALAAAAGLFSACQELEMVQTCAPEDVVAPDLHSIMQGDEVVEAITVTSDNMGETVTFAWDAADFGVKTQINYAIEAAYNGDTLTVITGLTGTSSEVTFEALNTPLALAVEDGGLGLPSGTPTEVNFLVSATIGNTFGTYYSEGIPVTMTVTQAERTYPMIYVIGDFCGWADGQTQELFSFSGDEVNYSGVIGFGGMASNGFKIRGTETGWSDDSNWGVDGEAAAPEAEAKSITLISSGGSHGLLEELLPLQLQPQQPRAHQRLRLRPARRLRRTDRMGGRGGHSDEFRYREAGILGRCRIPRRRRLQAPC